MIRLHDDPVEVEHEAVALDPFLDELALTRGVPDGVALGNGAVLRGGTTCEEQDEEEEESHVSLRSGEHRVSDSF